MPCRGTGFDPHDLEYHCGGCEDCIFGIPPKKDFPPGSCEHCGDITGVSLVRSLTCYPRQEPNRWQRMVELETPDPNPDLMLCRDCADEYDAYWSERWQEYYNSLM